MGGRLTVGEVRFVFLDGERHAHEHCGSGFATYKVNPQKNGINEQTFTKQFRYTGSAFDRINLVFFFHSTGQCVFDRVRAL